MSIANLTQVDNYNYGIEKIFDSAKDFLPINGTDYVELYVGNAKQAAHYYKTAFGFQSFAYCGLETGNKAYCSYVVAQDKIRLVLTTPFDPESEISDHIRRHGDGVKVIALWVDDARKAFEETTKRGAVAVMEPTVFSDENGEVVKASIKTYGDTIHTFVERKNYQGVFLPGFEKWESEYNPGSKGLKYIDHMVGNVALGTMNTWADFYANTMGFANLITFDDKDISTQYTALMSKVMTNGNGRIKFPINEPAKGLKKSQVEEYLDFYGGPGCQHIAVATDDIVFTIAEMRKSGVEFLHVPGTYYDTVVDRVGTISEDMNTLKSLGIMVDRDEEGYLLQIFTKPVEDRPTLFFEIIQRKGAKSFGKGNFQALFESIEAEQERRGTL
ncbi:MAG: 4-hydroxyphenylpyruvate dioxygenase [Bacteroidetes bacterium]|jgi:4-hydroxyphenylpyruvate dioxygenase|nr:4-hydroxyphenylpyruvate dioxygenase [Bacteroidota bacterium]HMT35507.1 4-hydroxyphenylpyruvate dioxygenase [Chitinophagaceae bacterium]MBK7587870.1 4-hydroxyphenylpyruvate dioxygenase [Bacteroidota bacterium]MBK8328944.1 4-hydroxyphenylpyruvate dioxygenase [Bacteroidota bacterium]MBK9302293.1 4-hydroxyphenylpyruvate dioxygenase [Bacteroidota bacterium]